MAFHLVFQNLSFVHPLAQFFTDVLDELGMCNDFVDGLWRQAPILPKESLFTYFFHALDGSFLVLMNVHLKIAPGDVPAVQPLTTTCYELQVSLPEPTSGWRVESSQVVGPGYSP